MGKCIILTLDYTLQCAKKTLSIIAWWFWPGNRTFLEVASMVVTWWIVTFLCNEKTVLSIMYFSQLFRQHSIKYDLYLIHLRLEWLEHIIGLCERGLEIFVLLRVQCHLFSQHLLSLLHRRYFLVSLCSFRQQLEQTTNIWPIFNVG